MINLQMNNLLNFDYYTKINKRLRVMILVYIIIHKSSIFINNAKLIKPV